MYHPTRGGVRGGRDQFSWDDVKVDKHRENYLGHSIKASVGRWQKGKDLFWYTRDKNSAADEEAAKEEIRRIKEEEEQAMREALGLAPKRASRPHGTRLDKHEFSELVKRGSTAEDLGAGHAEAAQVHGLGFSRAPRPWEESSSVEPQLKENIETSTKINAPVPTPSARDSGESDEERMQKKRRHEEKKREKHERREEKHKRREKREKHERKEKREKRHSDDKRRGKKEIREKRRHDSDSD